MNLLSKKTTLFMRAALLLAVVCSPLAVLGLVYAAINVLLIGGWFLAILLVSIAFLAFKACKFFIRVYRENEKSPVQVPVIEAIFMVVVVAATIALLIWGRDNALQQLEQIKQQNQLTLVKPAV